VLLTFDPSHRLWLTDYFPSWRRSNLYCGRWFIHLLGCSGCKGNLFAGKLLTMKRLGAVEEVSDIVLFLCSEACSFNTGASFDVSGGRAVY
jgi:hypothetical protein